MPVSPVYDEEPIRFFGKLDKHLLGDRIQNYLRAWDEKRFGPSRHIHKQGLWIPEEDQFVMSSAFVDQQWTLELPILQRISIFHIDQLPAKKREKWLQHYRACIKRQLVANGSSKTHLSKNPSMSGWVGALLEEFPDARFVVLVRDPQQCVPSSLRMMESSWQWKKWSAEDYAESLQKMTEISFASYRLPEQTLRDRQDVPHCFVEYQDLTSNPKQTVQSVYSALGLTMTNEFSAQLDQLQEREKKHKSKFKYQISDYAVTPQKIEEELEEFYVRYGWPRPSHAVSTEAQTND